MDVQAVIEEAAKALEQNDVPRALDILQRDLGQGKEDALRIICEIDGAYSASAKYFLITIRGRWHESEDKGFYRMVHVVADDEAEGLRYIARMEPESIRTSIRIKDAEVLEDAPDRPKGVYWCSGCVVFPENEEQ